MRRHRLGTLLTHWIAVLAIGSAVLLPTLTQLLAAAGADQLRHVAVCTSDGVRWVSLSADGTAEDVPAPGGEFGHTDHCPVCRVHGDAPPLPAADPRTVLATAATHAVPALFLHAPHTLHVWRSAHPRGPPALS
jgi:hypothetical protein